MAIPGYDPTDVHEIALEYQDESSTVPDSSKHEDEPNDGDRRERNEGSIRKRAHAAIVADTVPDSVRVRESDRTVPDGALTEPVELVGFEGIEGLETIQLTLEYDPAALPPGASPTDVAVGFQTQSGYEQVSSAVDLERTTVTAILTELPPGETIAPIHTADDEKVVGRVE